MARYSRDAIRCGPRSCLLQKMACRSIARENGITASAAACHDQMLHIHGGLRGNRNQRVMMHIEYTGLLTA